MFLLAWALYLRDDRPFKLFGRESEASFPLPTRNGSELSERRWRRKRYLTFQTKLLEEEYSYEYSE